LIVVPIIMAMWYRTVVPTNSVHIIQSSRKTTSYGKGQEAGNLYYAWPAWVPLIGVKTIELPVSVFDIPLINYQGYDIDRVPFVVDVMAFFASRQTN
jgi:flotillin